MKKIIFIILLACCQIAVFAQQAAKTFTVSGTVVDETDTPVPGASVYAKDRAGMGTATDVDGKFSLKVQKTIFSLFRF